MCISSRGCVLYILLNQARTVQCSSPLERLSERNNNNNKFTTQHDLSIPSPLINTFSALFIDIYYMLTALQHNFRTCFVFIFIFIFIFIFHVSHLGVKPATRSLSHFHIFIMQHLFPRIVPSLEVAGRKGNPRTNNHGCLKATSHFTHIPFLS